MKRVIAIVVVVAVAATVFAGYGQEKNDDRLFSLFLKQSGKWSEQDQEFFRALPTAIQVDWRTKQPLPGLIVKKTDDVTIAVLWKVNKVGGVFLEKILYDYSEVKK